jgi:hypothetical protein
VGRGASPPCGAGPAATVLARPPAPRGPPPHRLVSRPRQDGPSGCSPNRRKANPPGRCRRIHTLRRAQPRLGPGRLHHRSGGPCPASREPGRRLVSRRGRCGRRRGRAGSRTRGRTGGTPGSAAAPSRPAPPRDRRPGLLGRASDFVGGVRNRDRLPFVAFCCLLLPPRSRTSWVGCGTATAPRPALPTRRRAGLWPKRPRPPRLPSRQLSPLPSFPPSPRRPSRAPRRGLPPRPSPNEPGPPPMPPGRPPPPTVSRRSACPPARVCRRRSRPPPAG